MTLDYKKLGLKCGLEVHQQLDTGKLFCRCDSRLKEDKPDFTVERRLRPVPSELGEYDAAALEQFRRGNSFVYEAYNDSTCLVELDEEPPHPVNPKALEAVLEVSLITESKVFDELCVMRKTVIDGSNPSGFQRTALVSVGGAIKINGKEVGVQAIVLEEDAGRPMKREGKKIFYRLDRLGIPLIELATKPGIFSPEEALKTAEAIGEIFRRTGKAKRGLGTIRQDLNISIREGARTEVKGVQELALIKTCVEREAQRQLGLVEVMKELKSRGLSEKDLEQVPINLSKVFEKTGCGIIRKQWSKESVFGIKLKSFGGLVGKELQPNRRLGTEFADYVKARTGIKGIFHSDEMPDYGVSEKEVKEVSGKLKCGKEDAFIFLVGEKKKAGEALEVVVERAKKCLHGVPGETRDALPDGSNAYSRPLPGAARMYPETDIPRIIVDKKMLKRLLKKLPLSTKERVNLYIKGFGLNPALAQKMAYSNFAGLFEELVKKGASPTPTAVLLLEDLVRMKREGAKVERLSNEMLSQAIEAGEKYGVPRKLLAEALGRWTEEPGKDFKDVMKNIGGGTAGEKEIAKTVKGVVHKNRALIEARGEGAVRALMGDAMKALKGKADGKTLSWLLRKEIEKIK